MATTRYIYIYIYIGRFRKKCTLVQALSLCTGRTAQRGRLYSSWPTVLEGGKGSASRPGRSLPPGKTWYPLYRRLGGPQGRSGQVRNISPPPGFDPRTVQPVASRYTDWATRPTDSERLINVFGGDSNGHCEKKSSYERVSNYEWPLR